MYIEIISISKYEGVNKYNRNKLKLTKTNMSVRGISSHINSINK